MFLTCQSINAVALLSLGKFPDNSERLALYDFKSISSVRTHAYIGLHFNILFPVLIAFSFPHYGYFEII